MVTQEWGVRWADTGNVTVCENEAAARRVASEWPDRGEVVSRWVSRWVHEEAWS